MRKTRKSYARTLAACSCGNTYQVIGGAMRGSECEPASCGSDANEIISGSMFEAHIKSPSK
jgi:hypothetical protein